MDEEERNQEDELIHALVSNPEHEIPIGDYRMLLMLYPVLNQVLTALTFMKSELVRLQGDVEQHTDYLIQLATEYEGFNGELIDPAIEKLNNILIPANIIIGLLSHPDYVLPVVDTHILDTIRALIGAIQTSIRTATPADRRGVINEYYALIPGFNPGEIPDALAKLDRVLEPQPQSQSMDGGKRSNKRSNKRSKRKKNKKRKTKNNS